MRRGLLALALVLAGCSGAGIGDGPASGEVGGFSEGSDRVAGQHLPPPSSRLLRVERSWRKVVVDAGHGGDDEGAHGVSGFLEKDITLAIARETSARLRQAGFEVVETRTDDTTVLLDRRTGLANASGAGLLVSIHANSAPSSAAHGIETYFMDLASDEAALRLAERENRAGAVVRTNPDQPADPLDSLVSELRMGATARQSRDLAHKVHKALLSGLGAFYGTDKVRDREVRTAPFWVLLDSEIPAILVEVGYVTHEREEKRLRTRGFHMQAAKALARGIEAFADRAAQASSSDGAL